MSSSQPSYGYGTNGWTLLRDALVPLDDRGLLLGEVLFESILVVNGLAIDLSAHWRRFSVGLKAFRFPLAAVQQEFWAVSQRMPKTSGRYALRVNATRGPYQRVRPGDDLRFRLSATLKPVSVPSTFSVGWSQGLRSSQNALPEGIKHGGYLQAIWALLQAEEDDVVLRNADGYAAELTTSNLYVLLGDTLFTPSVGEQALPGIARQRVIKAALAAGLEVKEQRLTKASLGKCEAAFASSATRGLFPITKLLGRFVPVPRGFANSEKLLHAYARVEAARVRQAERLRRSGVGGWRG